MSTFQFFQSWEWVNLVIVYLSAGAIYNFKRNVTRKFLITDVRNGQYKFTEVESGCGSVGRAVASDIRGPRFESSLRQTFINIEQLLYTVNCVLKRRKIEKKRPGMAHFFKKNNLL